MEYEERTERKLRYAKVHLDELIAYPRHRYDDFHRAHCESFLFHLIGARDSFLQEINIAHGLGLDEGQVISKHLREKLKKENKESHAFDELTKLQKKQHPPSWLYKAIYFRNIGTHRLEMSRFMNINIGSDDEEKTELICPPKKGQKRGQTSGRDFIDDFTDWYNNMKKLIEELREQLP